jgi:hypothetical protein
MIFGGGATQADWASAGVLKGSKAAARSVSSILLPTVATELWSGMGTSLC